MSEQKKCPKCGFKGHMNTYSQYKRVNSKLVMITECYCPKCNIWIKI